MTIDVFTILLTTVKDGKDYIYHDIEFDYTSPRAQLVFEHWERIRHTTFVLKHNISVNYIEK